MRLHGEDGLGVQVTPRSPLARRPLVRLAVFGAALGLYASACIFDTSDGYKGGGKRLQGVDFVVPEGGDGKDSTPAPQGD